MVLALAPVKNTMTPHLVTKCWCRTYGQQRHPDRLQKYINDTGIGPDDRIWPITYAAARIIVKKVGERYQVPPLFLDFTFFFC